jgi:hypothetical protein
LRASGGLFVRHASGKRRCWRAADRLRRSGRPGPPKLERPCPVVSDRSRLPDDFGGLRDDRAQLRPPACKSRPITQERRNLNAQVESGHVRPLSWTARPSRRGARVGSRAVPAAVLQRLGESLIAGLASVGIWFGVSGFVRGLLGVLSVRPHDSQRGAFGTMSRRQEEPGGPARRGSEAAGSEAAARARQGVRETRATS